MKNPSQARRKRRRHDASSQVDSIQESASPGDQRKTGPAKSRRTTAQRRRAKQPVLKGAEFDAKEYKVVCLRDCPCPSEMFAANSPDLAATYWNVHVQTNPQFNPDVECLVALLLNTRHRVIGHHLVSIGTLNTTLAHPREIFRIAVIAAANSIVLMHNHPSGDPKPSYHDLVITRQIYEAGLLLKIELLDHVIVGRQAGAYRSQSLKELGHFCEFDVSLE